MGPATPVADVEELDDAHARDGDDRLVPFDVLVGGGGCDDRAAGVVHDVYRPGHRGIVLVGNDIQHHLFRSQG